MLDRNVSSDDIACMNTTNNTAPAIVGQRFVVGATFTDLVGNTWRKGHEFEIVLVGSRNVRARSCGVDGSLVWFSSECFVVNQ